MKVMEALHVYDTTLRDGAQREGLNLSVSDKLAIAGLLDDLGGRLHRGRLAGGQPEGHRVLRARQVRSCTCVTRRSPPSGRPARAGGVATEDLLVQALLDSGASVVTLVAKSHRVTSSEALRTTLEENLAMVRDTVGFLVGQGGGSSSTPSTSSTAAAPTATTPYRSFGTAAEAGAEVVVLCDTNGGMLPRPESPRWSPTSSPRPAPGRAPLPQRHRLRRRQLRRRRAARATHVQGTVNGYGERTGNADLITVVANLQLKPGYTPWRTAPPPEPPTSPTRSAR